jgi:hypothetical protein
MNRAPSTSDPKDWNEWNEQSLQYLKDHPREAATILRQVKTNLNARLEELKDTSDEGVSSSSNVIDIIRLTREMKIFDQWVDAVREFRNQ